MIAEVGEAQSSSSAAARSSRAAPKAATAIAEFRVVDEESGSTIRQDESGRVYVSGLNRCLGRALN